MDPLTFFVVVTALTTGVAKGLKARKQAKRKEKLGYGTEDVQLTQATLCVSDRNAELLEELGATELVARMMQEGKYIEQGAS